LVDTPHKGAFAAAANLSVDNFGSQAASAHRTPLDSRFLNAFFGTSLGEGITSGDRSVNVVLLATLHLHWLWTATALTITGHDDTSTIATAASSSVNLTGDGDETEATHAACSPGDLLLGAPTGLNETPLDTVVAFACSATFSDDFDCPAVATTT